MKSVATIVCEIENALSPAMEREVAGRLSRLGLGGVEMRALSRGRAADFIFPGSSPALHDAARKALFDLPRCDVFVQNAEGRRKRLLMSDMDATMVVGETIDAMADAFKLSDQIAPITVRAMRGEIEFAESLRLRIGLMRGQPLEPLFGILKNLRHMKGARTLVATMRAQGARCVLISGGFDLFTSVVGRDLGFHKDYGNRLDVEAGRLTGDIGSPVIDKAFKKKILFEECRTLSISPAECMAVGDGANDIDMLQAAGIGVGYFGKPAVQAATPWQVRYTDLTALLYLQGYTDAEFRA